MKLANGRNRLIYGGAALAAVAIAASSAVALSGSSGGPANNVSLSANTAAAGTTGGYQFVTLNDHRDRTFNQLLGIDNEGVIAGYFGSGAKGHPNKGYVLRPPYAQNDYINVNFPGSRQTQVTGLNDNGGIVGFWSTMNTASMTNNNFGFVTAAGRLTRLNFPTGDNARPQVDQFLGVNNHNIAVGFYTNGQGSNRGFMYNIRTRKFTRVLVPGAPASVAGPSLTAAGINNNGDVAGFYNKNASTVVSFLRLHTGRFTTFSCQFKSMKATSTQALGVNDSGEVVGTFTVGSGNNAVMHGFTWRAGQRCATVDDPAGPTSTTVNGVNDEGDLVGFYTDAAGNTDGMFALPKP